ncbi:MAG: AraC family transcriptional regulator [Clostridia bacterium]|nr:AraC family transcriptional regulator [Clostridia bacterium]
MNEAGIDRLCVTLEYFIHRFCTPQWEIAEMDIDFVDITYVVAGEAEYTVDDVRYRVSAGDLLCIPKWSHRSAVSFPGRLMECYCVNGQVFDPEAGDIAPPLPLVSHIGLRQDIIALYRDLNAAWLLRDPGTSLRVRALYMMILQRYLQLILYKDVGLSYDTRIKKALRYMIDHYAEPLTAQGIAGMLGLSGLYFGSFFKRETGLSFRQYLTSIRLNHAEDMLGSGEYNVNEVAAACGFSDVFYFSRVFKEHRGVAPSRMLHTKKRQPEKGETRQRQQTT